MRRRLLLVMAMGLLCSASLHGQCLQLQAGYRYLLAPRWDRMIQTYNFSRPFLTARQPLLQHGWGVGASYSLASSSAFSHGLRADYSHFGSHAQNDGLDNSLSLHQLQVGYQLQYQQPEGRQGTFVQASLSAVGTALYRSIDGEPFYHDYDETRAKALGLGVELEVEAGYEIALAERISLAPAAGVGFTPYLYSPSTSAVILQAVPNEDYTWVYALHLRAGVGVRLR